MHEALLGGSGSGTDTATAAGAAPGEMDAGLQMDEAGVLSAAAAGLPSAAAAAAGPEELELDEEDEAELEAAGGVNWPLLSEPELSRAGDDFFLAGRALAPPPLCCCCRHLARRFLNHTCGERASARLGPGQHPRPAVTTRTQPAHPSLRCRANPAGSQHPVPPGLVAPGMKAGAPHKHSPPYARSCQQKVAAALGSPPLHVCRLLPGPDRPTTFRLLCPSVPLPAKLCSAPGPPWPGRTGLLGTQPHPPAGHWAPSPQDMPKALAQGTTLSPLQSFREQGILRPVSPATPAAGQPCAHTALDPHPLHATAPYAHPAPHLLPACPHYSTQLALPRNSHAKLLPLFLKYPSRKRGLVCSAQHPWQGGTTERSAPSFQHLKQHPSP